MLVRKPDTTKNEKIEKITMNNTFDEGSVNVTTRIRSTLNLKLSVLAAEKKALGESNKEELMNEAVELLLRKYGKIV